MVISKFDTLSISLSGKSNIKPIKIDIETPYGNEKELKSNDGLIMGTADRIIQSNNGAIIFDMKTGDIKVHSVTG